MSSETRPLDPRAPAPSERRGSGWWAPRAQLVLALCGSVTAAAACALGVWLSLRDGVSGATSGFARHETALVELRADLSGLRASQATQAITLAEIRAEQRASAETGREIRETVREIAREVRGR